MKKFFFFLIGFGLTIIGSIYIIIYLNLIAIGYNLKEYVNFIIRRPECLNFLLGFFLMMMNLPKEEKNELYLRHIVKF